MADYKEYIIKDNDTIESIALRELGDASEWRAIALLNNLDFPYIVAEKEQAILEQRSVAASGIQTFGVTNAAPSPILIPRGLVLEMEFRGLRDLGDRPPRYTTVMSRVIPAGSFTTTIQIVCEAPGHWGNAVARSITKMVEDGQGNVLLNTGEWVPRPAIDFTYNEFSLTNGQIRNIKTTSETILIPTNVDQIINAPRKSYEEELGGIDLLLNAEGDLSVDPATGDLALARGFQNIHQRIRNSLNTRRGELKHHAWYGTNTPFYAGRAGAHIRELIRVDIIDTIKQTDVVEDVEITHIEVRRDAVIYSAEIKLVGTDRPVTINNMNVAW